MHHNFDGMVFVSQHHHHHLIITQFEHIISYITCIERKTKNVLRWKWFLEFYSNIWQYINCTLCKYILNILDIWKCNLFSVKMALLPFTWFLFFGWKRMKAPSLMVGITRLRYRSIHPSCCQLFSINVAGRINSIIHLAVMDVRTLFLFCSLLLFFFRISIERDCAILIVYYCARKQEKNVGVIRWKTSASVCCQCFALTIPHPILL